MKRMNKLLILLGILVLAVGGIFLTSKLVKDSAIKPPAEQYSVFSVDPESITEISWEYEDEKSIFIRQDGKWAYQEDPSIPLNELFLTNLLSNLRAVTSIKTIEEPGDPAQYGLDSPSCIITVTADGTQKQMKFGDETGMGGKRYVSNGDEKVYLISSSLLENFSYHLLDLVQVESIPAISRIDSYTVTGGAEELTLLHLEDVDGEPRWAVKQGDSEVPIHAARASNLATVITTVVFDRCANCKVDDTVLQEYGLGDDALTLTVNYTDPEGAQAVFTLVLSKDGKYGYPKDSTRLYTVNDSIVKNFAELTAAELTAVE